MKMLMNNKNFLVRLFICYFFLVVDASNEQEIGFKRMIAIDISQIGSKICY